MGLSSDLDRLMIFARLEEPRRWSNDRRATRDVRLAAGVRVCAGQSEYSAAGCRDLMAEGAIDVCNFVANRPPLRDGWIELPQGAGLGWNLDLDYVERHCVST